MIVTFIHVPAEKRKHKLMVWDLHFISLFLNLWLLDLLETIEEILPSLPEDITVWGMSDSVPQGVTSLKEKLSMASDRPVPRSYHVASSLKSPHLYIFTSGTTGRIHFFSRIKKECNIFAKRQELPSWVLTKTLRKHASKRSQGS